ncbi:hypothetical protein ACIBED_07640 [Rhodococcus coprophilus]|uniref:ABC transporter transmembrane protein n=1 Tax=Rhodococcus coprophilus TaxID=38310 RepID=A0A2X4UFA7_9NOCA|nr:hypothetical protein [Rhodococcus coprophilus]MBM7458685.1 putative membrane protein [Rhodococcus coprophilus]SQI33202.1 ABC transporter transmembrane protein [Rhodococcus coprophilus]
MYARFLPVSLFAAGAVLIGSGSVFAYTDDSQVVVVAGTTDATATTDSTSVDDARSTLQQASLPLALLNGGVGQLADGSRQLDAGAIQLADGLTQAHEGGKQLADGLGQLEGGVGQLGDGASQISAGVDEVVTRLTGFGEMQGSVTARLSVVADTLAASGDPVSAGTAGELRALVDMLNTQGLGPDTLDQLGQLRDGANQLSYELTDPEAQFVAGMSQAAEGSRQLRDGLMQLDDGGRQLVDGTGRLVGGVEPVGNVVKGISENVRDATGALPAPGSQASVGSPEQVAAGAQDAAETGVAAKRWWPYALIALGAVALAAAALLPAGIRPAAAHGRRAAVR